MKKAPSAKTKHSTARKPATYTKCVLVRVRDKSGKLLGYVAEPEKTHQYGDLGCCKPWYQITCDESTGIWACTCPSRKPCKHIEAAQALNEIRLGVAKAVPPMSPVLSQDDNKVSTECQSVPTQCPTNAHELPVEGDKDLPEEDRRYITIVPVAPLMIDDGDGQSIYEDQETLASTPRLSREAYAELFDVNHVNSLCYA